jgi:hypothetical protein
VRAGVATFFCFLTLICLGGDLRELPKDTTGMSRPSSSHIRGLTGGKPGDRNESALIRALSLSSLAKRGEEEEEMLDEDLLTVVSCSASFMLEESSWQRFE